jgi:hypothetical protein
VHIFRRTKSTYFSPDQKYIFFVGAKPHIFRRPKITYFSSKFWGFGGFLELWSLFGASYLQHLSPLGTGCVPHPLHLRCRCTYSDVRTRSEPAPCPARPIPRASPISSRVRHFRFEFEETPCITA